MTATTGRLRILSQILAIYADDLANGDRAERDAAAVLSALDAAIQLEATAELAALAKRWLGGEAVARVRGAVALEADADRAREDVVAGLARGVGRGGPKCARCGCDLDERNLSILDIVVVAESDELVEYRAYCVACRQAVADAEPTP